MQLKKISLNFVLVELLPISVRKLKQLNDYIIQNDGIYCRGVAEVSK